MQATDNNNQRKAAQQKRKTINSIPKCKSVTKSLEN